MRLPLSGVPIYYRRCAACEFLFTDAFDDWSTEQFKKHIYNAGYHAIDPDYETVRPQANAAHVVSLWDAYKNDTRVLDYGGGNDAFCTALRARGFSVAVSYDPMVPERARLPEQKFDLVTCFETFEHTPDPAGTIAKIITCMAEPGLVMYTTLVQPGDFNRQGLNWWYVGPRNGHVSLYSRRALQIAWARHGYKAVSLADNIHFAFRTLPQYAGAIK